MFIQFYTADTNIPGHSLEFSVYRTSLQVAMTTQEGQSNYRVYVSLYIDFIYIKEELNSSKILGKYYKFYIKIKFK